MFGKTFSFWRRWIGTESAAAQSAAVEDERRLWVRYAADVEGNVQLSEHHDNARILARVRDLSIGGANIVLDRQLRLGDILSLELPTARNETRTVLACVVRARPCQEGGWSLGCVFARELTAEDLTRCGAQKVSAAADDQRTWVRFPCRLSATFRQVGDPAGQPHGTQILNISANGIGLAVQRDLAAGTLLNVDLVDTAGLVVRTILACVVHTTARSSGNYAVGCNFIRELSEDELQSIL